MKTLNIDAYKKAISNLFNTVIFEKDNQDNDNPFYCYKSLFSFFNTINERLLNNTELKGLDSLYEFNETLYNLLNEITRFFVAINKYDGIDKSYVQVSYINVNQSFKNLQEFDRFIIKYVQSGNFDSAILIKDYFSNLISEAILFLDNNLQISINKCEFKSDIDKVNLRLENSINYSEVSLRMKIKSNSKKEVNQSPTFFDFIFNVKNKTDFALDLKNIFNIEKGIEFKIMIEVLREKDVFIIGDRKFAHFFRAIKPYFNRDIGSQNSLNDLYNHSSEDKEFYADKIDGINKKLVLLLKKHLVA
jgi:hypothetical protein